MHDPSARASDNVSVADIADVARILVLALLAILGTTWPFATVKLPEISAFVPSLAAALFVSDRVTPALLFGQFSILRQWALLVIANGYFFSALIVVAHALALPCAFSPSYSGMCCIDAG